MHPPIKIGILFAQKGQFAQQEKPIIDAILFAIHEINKGGGINNQHLQPVFTDNTLTTTTHFAQAAEYMIVHDKVDCLIGCRDFISRAPVKDLVEKYNTLLLYPLQWEGLEYSPNILYLGTTPNQQIIPTIMWACSNFGKKITIVGANTFFTHSIYPIITYYITALKGTVLQSHFIPAHASNYDTILDAMKKQQPDVILNIVSEYNQSKFFKQLYQTGLTPQNIPLVSLIFSDNDQELRAENLLGSYVSKPYFHNLKSVNNKTFIDAFERHFPHRNEITTSMQTAYVGIHLWAQAIKEAKSTNYALVHPCLLKQTMAAPEGPVAVDAPTQCCWHTIRINKIINTTYSINIWDSGRPVAPLPYPPFNTKEQWHLFIEKLKAQEGAA